MSASAQKSGKARGPSVPAAGGPAAASLPAAELRRQILSLTRLSQLEWEARQAETAEALGFIAVNDTHRVVPYDHAALWLAGARSIGAVSGALRLEPTAPQIVWLSRLARHQAAEAGAGGVRPIADDRMPAALAADRRRWIPGEAIWIPLSGPGGGLEGGLVLMRAQAFGEAETRLLGRIGGAYGHSLAALRAPRPVGRSIWFRRLLTGFLLLALAGLLAMPVRLTVLAAAKVAPGSPLVVASPLAGVVREIAVEPDQTVAAGELLLRLDTTELEAARDLAVQKVAVLSADRMRTEQRAFEAEDARAELALARARLAEGERELAYAEERLARSEVRALRPGIVLIDEPSRWIGRPVRVGERILSLAEPADAEIEIHVPIEDALVLEAGAEVQLFLATAPAQPIAARLTRVSYEPQLLPDQSFAFVARATLNNRKAPPRLGLTGTAKIYGRSEPLYYVLLRKPLASLRRMTGL